MTRFLLRFAALLLPLSLIAAPAAAQVVVQKPGGSEDYMVLALMATGSEADKSRFENAATELGYNPGRTKNNADEDEVMVVVRPDADRGKFLKFRKIRQADLRHRHHPLGRSHRKARLHRRSAGLRRRCSAIAGGVRGVIVYIQRSSYSNCGISVEGKRAFGVQYHPEASPGPMDSFYLFERFVGMLG
jgi:hypothetical protein